MIENLERLRQSAVFWGALALFAMIFIGLTAASLTGTFLEDYTIQFRLAGVGGMVICFVIGLLVLAVEPVGRVGRYLDRSIKTSARFVRENLLLVAALVAVTLLLWRLFDLGLDLAVFSIVPLLMAACIAVTVGFIRLLAMTRPSFLGLAAARTDLWHYDFIDHFAEAEKRFPLLPGSIIEPRRNARCGEERMRAIFEHPPDDPNEYSTLTYNLTLAPGTRPLELRGFTGIMTELSEAAGPRPSQRSPENSVLFEIWINEKREYKRQKYASEWEEFSIRVPRQDILGIRFSTNCLGIAHFNWAAWGEPRLLEVTD